MSNGENQARWHKAHGEFVDCEVVDAYANQSDVPTGKTMKDPVKIKVGKKVHVVPAHQLYDWDRGPSPAELRSQAKVEARGQSDETEPDETESTPTLIPGVTTTTVSD